MSRYINAVTNYADDDYYCQIWSPEGTVYNTSSGLFEAFNASNWEDYAIDFVRQGTSMKFLAELPAALEDTGIDYNVTTYLLEGASPAQTDLGIDDAPINDQRALLLTNPTYPIETDSDGYVTVSNIAAVATGVWESATRTLSAFSFDVGSASITAIKAVTDTLNGLLENVSGYRWTAKALEQAPGSGDATEAKQDTIIAAIGALSVPTAADIVAELNASTVDGAVSFEDAMQILLARSIGKMVKTSENPLTYEVYAQDAATVVATLVFPLDRSGRNNS